MDRFILKYNRVYLSHKYWKFIYVTPLLLEEKYKVLEMKVVPV
jgi:hypothetical protein